MHTSRPLTLVGGRIFVAGKGIEEEVVPEKCKNNKHFFQVDFPDRR